MRLSLGQDLRLVQKQVLAPRMIQSMEILQLPILALQERIEQEMEENPVLELQEEDPELPAEAEERDAPDAPTEEERELVIDESHSNEQDFERLMKMDEEYPDHFEERSHPSRGEIEEAGERKLDAMANMASRPQSLQDYLHDQLGWFDLEPELRAMADRIIYNLDPNGYVARAAGGPVGARGGRGRPGPGPAGVGAGAEARSARRRGARPARVPVVAVGARHALLRSSSAR